MSPAPGRILMTLTIDLPRPRDLAIRESPEFGAYTRQIRGVFQEMGMLRSKATRRQ
jgi:NitT/TauT family transport system ATP-binding protein